MSAEHETPETDHTPAAAKALSIGLVAWCLFGGLLVVALYVLLKH